MQAGPAGPHGPGVVIEGEPTIFINNLPVVAKGHKVVEAAGGVSTVQMGCGTVFFGNGGAGGAGGGGSGSTDSHARAEEINRSGSSPRQNASCGTEPTVCEKEGTQVCEEKTIQLHVVDPATGMPAASRPFVLKSSTATHSGVLDSDGRATVSVGSAECSWELQLDLE